VTRRQDINAGPRSPRAGVGHDCRRPTTTASSSWRARSLVPREPMSPCAWLLAELTHCRPWWSARTTCATWWPSTSRRARHTGRPGAGAGDDCTVDHGPHRARPGNGELYYPPTNPDVTPPAGRLPPLIVRPHPGPTANTTLRLDPALQFFTSRGYAVLDLDYRGSTGYGRAYRQVPICRGSDDVLGVVKPSTTIPTPARHAAPSTGGGREHPGRSGRRTTTSTR
jgi:hypothetical protein